MSYNNIQKTEAPIDGLVKVPEALAILKIGRTKANQLMQSGILHRVKIGRATRITRASIQRIVGEG